MEIEILERSRYVGRTYILAPSFFILLLPFLSKCVNVHPLAESHAETPSAVERKDWLAIVTVLAVHYYLVLNFTKPYFSKKILFDFAGKFIQVTGKLSIHSICAKWDVDFFICSSN